MSQKFGSFTSPIFIDSDISPLLILMTRRLGNNRVLKYARYGKIRQDVWRLDQSQRYVYTTVVHLVFWKEISGRDFVKFQLSRECKS